MHTLKIISLPTATLLLGLMWSFNKPAPAPLKPAYPEKLPGAFTGGFGEETCHSCHFDYPLNPNEGSLLVEGVPDPYQPGKQYSIAVTVKRRDLGQAGFQLSSRFENGNQAGSLKASSEQLTFTETKNSIQYLQHSLIGSKVDPQTPAQWEILWRAPDSSSGTVIFNIAANAGNGDASAFGDYIFAREIKIEGSTN